MALEAVLRNVATLAVVTYLCAAGWFFILAPWSAFWSTRVVSEAPYWLYAWLAHPALRGAVSGFGVLHFPVAFAWLARGARHS